MLPREEQDQPQSSRLTTDRQRASSICSTTYSDPSLQSERTVAQEATNHGNYPTNQAPEVRAAGKNTNRLAPSRVSQVHLAGRDQEARPEAGIPVMDSNVSKLMPVSNAWSRDALGVYVSTKSQAASSTDREQTQSSNSNTVSRTDSSASGVVRQLGEPAFSECADSSKVAANRGSKMTAKPSLHSGNERDKIRANDSDSSAAWSGKNILALDGGGIRGYSTLLIIQYLMHKIAQLEKPYAGNSFHPLQSQSPIPEEPIDLLQNVMTMPGEMEEDSLRTTSHYLPCHYFDYITGTSTGGVIAIMLGRFGMTIAEALLAYESFGNEVFKHPRTWHIRNFPLWSPQNKYDAGRVERFFQHMVQTHEPSQLARFPQKHPDMCRTIVVAMQRDEITTTPYLFRSYPHPSPSNGSTSSLHCPQKKGDDLPIWKVARATTAAPFYFRAVEMEEHGENTVYVDGGFGANNPSEQVYASIQELSDNDPRSVRALVSIGTGKPPHASSRKKALVKLSNSNLRWIPRFIGSAIVQATNSETIHGRVNRQLRDQKVPYVRLNVEEGIGDIKLDAFRGKNGCKTLRQLRLATQEYLSNEEVKDKIEKLAGVLVDIRRKRAYLQAPSATPIADQKLTKEGPDTINTATTEILQGTDDAAEKRQDRWEIFVCGVVYTCKIPEKCDWTRERTGSRQDLRDHYHARHGLNAHGPEMGVALDKAKRYPIRESAAQNKEEGAAILPRSTFASR